MSKRRRRIITLVITETWTITWTGQVPPTAPGPPNPASSVVAPPASFAHHRPVEWQTTLQWHIEETVYDE